MQWARPGRLGFPVIGLSDRIPNVDVCLIDTAAHTPGMSKLDADLWVIPCRPSAADLRATLLTLKEIPNTAKAVVMFTQVPPRSTEVAYCREVLDSQDVLVLQAQLRQAIAFVRALALGVVVKDLPANVKGACWNDVTALGQEVSQWL